MGFDLSDLQALMGGSFEEPTGETGGVWVVTPDGTIDDGMLRLIGKGRVVADALGGYVYLLAGCNAAGADTEGGDSGGRRQGADRGRRAVASTTWPSSSASDSHRPSSCRARSSAAASGRGWRSC